MSGTTMHGGGACHGNGVYQYFKQIYLLVTHELAFLRGLVENFPEKPVWLRNSIYYCSDV